VLGPGEECPTHHVDGHAGGLERETRLTTAVSEKCFSEKCFSEKHFPEKHVQRPRSRGRARYTRMRAKGGTCMGASDEPNAASPSSVESSILVCPARPPPVTLPFPPPSPLKTFQHQNGPASEGWWRADLPDHCRRERRIQPRALHLREPCLARAALHAHATTPPTVDHRSDSCHPVNRVLFAAAGVLKRGRVRSRKQLLNVCKEHPRRPGADRATRPQRLRRGVQRGSAHRSSARTPQPLPDHLSQQNVLHRSDRSGFTIQRRGSGGARGHPAAPRTPRHRRGSRGGRRWRWS